jgi:hypothetical protein
MFNSLAASAQGPTLIRSVSLLRISLDLSHPGIALFSSTSHGTRFSSVCDVVGCALGLENHFSEWARFDCNYDILPTRLTGREFIHEYLKARQEIASNALGITYIDQRDDLDEEIFDLMI